DQKSPRSALAPQLVGFILRGRYDAVAATLDGLRHTPMHKFSGGDCIAHVTPRIVVETGEHRKPGPLYIMATISPDTRVYGLAVPMHRDEADASVGGASNAFFHRLADIEHLGVQEYLLPGADERLDEAIDAFGKGQPEADLEERYNAVQLFNETACLAYGRHI